MKSIKWAAEDVKVLTDYYLEIDPDLFSVKEISFILSRSEDAITIKAGKLGLTNAKRKLSTKTKERMSNSQKLYFSNHDNRRRLSKQIKDSIKKNGHPRGMKGKHHTDKTKSVLAEKARNAAKGRSDEDERKRILKGLKTRAKNGTLAPPRKNTSWKAGWREIGGYNKYYRSRWEANYARYLEWLKVHGKIREWLHEPDTFWFENIRRGVRSYLPDFKVTENNGDIKYHEVKGWMDDRSATKLKRMKKYYPEITIILIQQKQYTEISKKIGRAIKSWE